MMVLDLAVPWYRSECTPLPSFLKELLALIVSINELESQKLYAGVAVTLISWQYLLQSLRNDQTGGR